MSPDASGPMPVKWLPLVAGVIALATAGSCVQPAGTPCSTHDECAFHEYCASQ